MANPDQQMSYSPLGDPTDQHRQLVDNRSDNYTDFTMASDAQDDSSEATVGNHLTWTDGQPLATTAAPVRPSFQDTVTSRLSHLGHRKAASLDNDVPAKNEKAESPAQGTGEAEVESADFKEATVPVPRYWLLAVSVCLGLFLSILDTSIVATSIYTIGMHFNDMRTVNWVALAYTLTYLCCAVTFARVSDVIGRRKAFMMAYIIFFVFSLACGFSQSMQQLIAFRALQGVGGSGLYSLTLVILPELSPRHLKGYVSGIVGLVIACSGAAGPVLGGLLTEYATWRWVFWINGPIGFVSMICFFFAWPPREQLPTLPKRRWRDFDWLGTFLIISGAVLVVFPFQNAGEEGSGTWSKPVFIVPLIIGIFCLGALIVWGFAAQIVFKGRILLAFPVGLFRNPRYLSSVIVTLLAGFPYLLVIYSFPIRLQVVSRESPLMAGVMLLPMLGTLAFGAILNGAINKVRNYTAETQLVGTIMMTLGCGLMIMVDGSEDDTLALGFLTFIGLGFGLASGSASLFTLFECPISDYAPAQGIIAQVRVLGGSFGIAASTALTDRRTSQHLSSLFTEDQLMNLGHGSDGAEQISPAQAQGLDRAYTRAFQDGMIVSTALTAVSIIVALVAIRKDKRALVTDLQDDLVEQENKRRSVRPAVDNWEIEALKREGQLSNEGRTAQ